MPENVEYHLHISVSNYTTHIEYYGEDDTFLDEKQIKKIIDKRL